MEVFLDSSNKLNHNGQSIIMVAYKTFVSKIQLISMGDQIQKGKYRVHSRFHTFINFENNNHIVSLTNMCNQESPVNIILEGLDIQEIQSLSVLDDKIILNGLEILIKQNQIYQSSIDFNILFHKDYKELQRHIDLSVKALSNSAPKLSMAFLLDRKRECHFTSGFEKAYMRQVNFCIKEILYGDMIKGFTSLKGLGFGLTPSGDDFTAGALFAFYIIQKIHGHDLSGLRKRIYKNAVSSNLISGTFLSLALRGLFHNSLKLYIINLLSGNKTAIISKVREIADMGGTSGADLLSGFLFTLKKLENKLLI